MNVNDDLVESSISSNPFDVFGTWLRRAVEAQLHEPSAMALATSDERGRPSVRNVLLRGWDERGFCFYTNYESRKGIELAANPFAALLFYWDKLSRQIRIEGSVQRMSEAESSAYFESRPRGHRLAAWISEQSRVIAGREMLEREMENIERRFPGDVPRPPHWGGYRVAAERFEFWKSRPNRLHDRIVYRRHGNIWTIERLAP